MLVDAGDPPLHQAVRIELPVLVAIGAEPVAAVVAVFVGEADGDAISCVGPHLLDQPIVELPRPFAGQESFDGGAALQEFRPVSPAAVRRVSQRHLGRIPTVPGVLGKARLLRGRCVVEGGQGRSAHERSPRALRVCLKAAFSASRVSIRACRSSSAQATSAASSFCGICCGQFTSQAATWNRITCSARAR